MKKAYNQPTIEIVRLQPFRLMEGSPVSVSSEDYNEGTQTIAAKGSGGFWSDDDEPEEVDW